MARWVEWVEPFVDSEPVYMRCRAETAIKFVKKNYEMNNYSKPPLPNDEECLLEFQAVEWATVYETEDPYGNRSIL